MNEKEIIEKFLSNNYLVSPDFIEKFDDIEVDFTQLSDGPLVLNKDLLLILNRKDKFVEINWIEFEKSRSDFERGKDSKVYNNFLDILSYDINIEKKKFLDKVVEEIKVPDKNITIEKDEDSIFSVIPIRNYIDEEINKKEVNHFVKYFRLRYNFFKEILIGRSELQNAMSINKIRNNSFRDNVSIIGLVQEKKTTKNGHIILTLEDTTASVSVLVSKEKEELYNICKNIVLDEAIGISGIFNGEIIFCKNIYFPDIPLTKEVKKSKDEVLVAFISDIHVGSDKFLEKEFLNFISWLNCESGDEKQKAKALKVKYLFVVGDLVHGVGVYPGQENDTTIKDIYKQYEKLAYYIEMIREDIKIIMCPGDHDATRLEHPQLPVDNKIAKGVWEMKNLVFVTNPALVNIHASKDFPGFDVLMYHGHGYHYYVDASEQLRKGEAIKNPRNIMKFLLQKRHLAPSHTSTIYLPNEKVDPLAIEKIPDIFVSGHLHKCDIGSYNNVVTINSSCWQSVTDFEIKTGNFPDPCKVPLFNLKTRECEVLSFNDEQ